VGFEPITGAARVNLLLDGTVLGVFGGRTYFVLRRLMIGPRCSRCCRSPSVLVDLVQDTVIVGRARSAIWAIHGGPHERNGALIEAARARPAALVNDDAHPARRAVQVQTSTDRARPNAERWRTSEGDMRIG
jgi:hypothetical protein